jgi:hypothetical protein
MRRAAEQRSRLQREFEVFALWQDPATGALDWQWAGAGAEPRERAHREAVTSAACFGASWRPPGEDAVAAAAAAAAADAADRGPAQAAAGHKASSSPPAPPPPRDVWLWRSARVSVGARGGKNKPQAAEPPTGVVLVTNIAPSLSPGVAAAAAVAAAHSSSYAGRLTIGVLKSVLQKAVRRRCAAAAVRVAWALMHHADNGLVEFLRRIQARAARGSCELLL